MIFRDAFLEIYSHEYAKAVVDSYTYASLTCMLTFVCIYLHLSFHLTTVVI